MFEEGEKNICFFKLHQRVDSPCYAEAFHLVYAFSLIETFCWIISLLEASQKSSMVFFLSKKRIVYMILLVPFIDSLIFFIIFTLSLSLSAQGNGGRVLYVNKILLFLLSSQKCL